MTEVSLPTKHDATAPGPERFTSTNLADFPLPKGREEAWRFTPLTRLKSLLADRLEGGPVVVSFEGNAVGVGAQLAFVGGILSLSEGGAIVPVAGAPFDRAGVVAWNNISQTVELELQGEATQPVVLDLSAQGREGTVGHIRILARPASRATVLLRHTGAGSLNETVEVRAEAGSDLNLVSLQEWEEGAKHVSTHQVDLRGDAKVQHSVITLGGDLVRIHTAAQLHDPRADVNLLGLYFTGSNQHQEHRLFVEHIGEKAKSRVGYKGALQGQNAHAVWVGDVGIGAKAYGTDSYEYNRNLVLGLGPKVDSVPNLEIHNGEIEGAGHASATGRFDDEQLFYLQSRGIDPVAARRLVVKAFFAELLNEMQLPDLTEHVLETVDTRLAQESLQ